VQASLAILPVYREIQLPGGYKVLPGKKGDTVTNRPQRSRRKWKDNIKMDFQSKSTTVCIGFLDSFTSGKVPVSGSS
jgi:hypothetical protein